MEEIKPPEGQPEIKLKQVEKTIELKNKEYEKGKEINDQVLSFMSTINSMNLKMLDLDLKIRSTYSQFKRARQEMDEFCLKHGVMRGQKFKFDDEKKALTVYDFVKE